MLGGIGTDLLVTVTLLFLTQTGSQCRAENDFLLVTLPDLRPSAEHVTQCHYDRQTCDWTMTQLNSATEDVTVDILESGPLGLVGEACLEFWYRAPVTANGSEIRALLKSSDRTVEIWTLPALPEDSWRQVFIPLNITEPGTKVVFESIQALSMEEQIALDRIGVRRGSCGQQCESNTEFWTDESTRCFCSAGQLSCSLSQCPKGQICGPQRGDSRGISASGTCTIHSNTDCSTFDGVLFRFMAPCTYKLAQTCSPTEALPMFSVEVVNEQNENSSLPAVQQVIVETGNLRVSLLKEQTHRVVVNGIWRKLPLELSRGTVTIKSNPAAITLETSFGLTVSYDNAGAVNVNLPSTYSNQVCGLCGNFNHIRGDDFRKPDGTDAQDATALAESWQTGENISSCETLLVPHECDPLEEAEYASELYCGGLISTTGPFTDCLSVLGAESYFRGCMADMCSSHGDQEVLCGTLQAYADICRKAGVVLPIWRNSTFCSIQCGENSHYNTCADDCAGMCSSQDIVDIDSCGRCVEKCECDTGFKLSGGKCVPAEDCGCWSTDNKHYERGETWFQGECQRQCQCMGGNVISCSETKCARNEACRIEDGVKGCFPIDGATCSVYGDPHYITFDGLAYDFQGGCSYTLTTTCGEESSVQFSVIGHNMHPLHENFTRSKLEAVSLRVDDLYLTLNQSADLYVNNVHSLVPWSAKALSGSIWVFMKSNDIILETSFGLRMMIDGENRLFLQVDKRYKYELCGLCGTYSERQDDDFVTPGGQNVTGPFEFGDSWRVQDNDGCAVYPNDPRLCDHDEENEAYNECYALLGDAFKPCHEVIHPSIYLSSCVYDYCDTHGDQHTLCESLKSYAAACEFAGVELHNWQTGTPCAGIPTTAAPPATSAPTHPTPDQTMCPVNCDFEKNLCGWEQLVQDSFDWTRNSGPTPSSLTGPSQDHTTGAGFYIYLEGDSVTHGDSARLLSSACHYDGPLCLHYWYHMYGSATAMALNIYLLKDNKATKIWSRMNNQGPQWHPVHVDIRVPGPFQIIVEGIRGSNAQSDVAIDDISIQFGSCSGPLPGPAVGTQLPFMTTEILPPQPVCSIDCSFDSNLCSWNQMITDAFDWTWQSGSTPTMLTGPSADHTGGGHYLYIEASSATHGDTARLISSECSASGPQCLQFWYHMYGSADTMGLHVYLLQNRLADAVWWKRNNQGNEWQLAQVDFTPTGAFQIIIEGRRGSNEESDVAVDDIKLHHGRCSDLSGVVTTPPKPDGNTSAPTSVPVPTTAAPEPPLVNVTVQLPVTSQSPIANVTMPPVVEATTNIINKDNITEAPDNRPPLHPVCQLHCDFEQDLCQWSQLLTDVFDWTRHSGSTPTMMTGPSSDHTTGGGHYLYIEGNSATHGDTARLISSECSDSGPQCLQFWYHMYGSADTMGLHVYLLQNRLADAVWWKRNDQGNVWHLAQVDFTTTGAFQIIFEGRRGSNDQSDVAIDDVSLHRGRCADLVKPTAPASTTSNPITTASSGLPSANSSTATPTTTTEPQPPSNFTTTATTAATTHGDTQTTTTTATTVTAKTSNPDVSTSRPIATATTRAPTTAKPNPPTAEQGGPETSEQPELYTTEKPQTTERPQQPTTPTNKPQPPTTTWPQLQTTAEPQQPTTIQQTTAGPEPPATTKPSPPATAEPQPPTTIQSQPQTTAGPEPPATTKPSPPATAEPQPPTTIQPEPQTTAGPEPPATTTPSPPATAEPQPPTTIQPEPQTTAGPEPPATTTPSPPATAEPQPPTTIQPQPQTTAGPEPPATTKPSPPATAEPQPPTTIQPEPQTTAGPEPPATNQPKPQTTAGPEPPATTTPSPPATAEPQPPTTVKPQTTTPQPITTARPEPTTTAPPQPPTTAISQSTTTARPQPSSTPTPHCPENSHYTPCVPACVPTCTYVNGPPSCNANELCAPGCVCNEGFVQKWGFCVPIQQCGCVDSNGTKYDFNEVWYTNHCSHKCECEKHRGTGKIDCDDKDECDGNAVCLQNDEGDYYCQSTGFAECAIRSDSEYKTFDRLKYDFEGEHSYVLVQTKNLTANLPDVYIEGINKRIEDDDDDDSHHHEGSSSEEHHSHRVRDKNDDDDSDEDDDDDDDDDDSEEDEEHHRLQGLKIRVYDHTVEFMQKRRLVLDGRRTEAPVSPTGGLKIYEHSSRIYLKTDFGLTVEFDGHHKAEIILPRLYMRKVGGLCGNFDRQKRNDWMKPDGSVARNVQEFGESWRV